LYCQITFDFASKNQIFARVQSILISVILWIIFGLIQGFFDWYSNQSNGLFDELYTNLFYFSILGGLGVGLPMSLIFTVLTLGGGFYAMEVKGKIAPNQGIRESAKNALIFLLISPVFGWLSFAFTILSFLLGVLISGGPQLWPLFIQRFINNVPVFFAESLSPKYLSVYLMLGLLSAGEFGGFAYIQHYVLRFVLHRAGYIPWNYERFLDYAAERIFLQKVRGGYIFIHRLLMEHFAQFNLLEFVTKENEGNAREKLTG
jgi:hypothetical protein